MSRTLLRPAAPVQPKLREAFCPFGTRMEFTISKLRSAGNCQGLFVLRCSPRHYDKYYMSFVVGVCEHPNAAQ